MDSWRIISTFINTIAELWNVFSKYLHKGKIMHAKLYHHSKLYSQQAKDKVQANGLLGNNYG